MKKISDIRPLGIFDSGIGGLTVANAVHQLLPGETLVYFGDTAHLPYGDKSPEAIRKWSVAISDFLMTHNCKMLIIACNSISSVAFDAVKKHIGNKAIVVNVIAPVVEYVAHHKKYKKVGVIGTKATIKSDVYAKKITALNKKIVVASQATPLLAPMIEEGFFNNKISRTIINDYLSRPRLKNIDSLILGCTHYPLIRPEIEQFYRKKISIVDSAEIVALHIRSLLVKHHLLNTGKARKHHFYISDYTVSFEQSTKIFFSGKVKLEKKNLWK
ncbi:MAG: glutamate racemase [Bacteroidota bacterium]